MFNWFKKTKSWVRFYSMDQNVSIMYPVVDNRLTDRDWNNVGDISRNRPEQGKQTVLNCPAIKQITSVGYVLRAPADFIIKTGPSIQHLSWETPFVFKRHSDKYTFSGSEYYISWHSPSQTEPLIPKEISNTDKPYLHSAVKVETPWRVKASDDIVLLQLPVTYNNEARFTAAIGVLDPKYMHSVSVQLFWHVLEGETLVKAGTPLVQYVPVQRSLFQKNSVDFIVDTATDVEKEIEEAYAFANHSRFPKTDSAGNKVRVITQLFEYFRKKYPKSKI
jgi:hypothetical protein